MSAEARYNGTQIGLANSVPSSEKMFARSNDAVPIEIDPNDSKILPRSRNHARSDLRKGRAMKADFVWYRIDLSKVTDMLAVDAGGSKRT